MADDSEIGDDNVFVGPNPPKRMGDRNTIWTQADERGNVVIPGGTAVGHGARADSTSVAVGAFANAGDAAVLASLLEELEKLRRLSGGDAAKAVDDITAELQTTSPDRGIVARAWKVVKAAATSNEVLGLVGRVEPLLHHLHLLI